MKKRSREPSHRNRGPYGWWLSSYLLRLQYADENRSNPNRRCLAWENTIILRADDRQAAYAKAIRLGQENAGGEMREVATGRKGTWVFEGLTQLLPIHDELEDGAEILWTEHQGRSVRSVKSLVRTKRQLSVFDDEE
jgi:uncharacterized protein DUF4288